MGNLQLAVISILFLASRLRQAHGCFSKHDCCNRTQIHDLGTRLQGPTSTPPSAMDCQATSRGTVAQRSISPWTYTKDFSERRYPQNLWQASCSCNRCLSFKPTGQHNGMTYSNEDVRGNSVIVRSSILVFYREECPGRKDWFYLRPRNYMVNVSCACVVPMYSSMGSFVRS